MAGTITDKLEKALDTKSQIKTAIIEKGQTIAGTDPYDTYPAKIRAIQTGVDTSDATATAGDILSGKTAYANDEKVTGTITTKTASNLTASGATVTVPEGYYASQATKSVATATQATPTFSPIDISGKIIASVTQSAGYVSAGTKSATLQLTTQAAQTITPGTTDKTAVAAGRYTTGDVKVSGDANLVAENIKSGVSIFGVEGAVEEGVDTSDATAAAGDMLSGKTAYVKGSKVTGTIVSQAATTITPGTVAKTAVAAKRYTTGAVKVAGDANLLAENIKSGVTIFGVTGTMETEGVDTSDATATATNIISGKTVYANGKKLTGSLNVAGIHWISTTLPANAFWYSVTYGAGKFVAVAGTDSMSLGSKAIAYSYTNYS